MDEYDDDDDLVCTTDPNARRHDAPSAEPAHPNNDDDDGAAAFERELRERKFQHEMESAVEHTVSHGQLAAQSALANQRRVVPSEAPGSARRTSAGSSVRPSTTDVSRMVALEDELRALSNQIRSHERAQHQLTQESEKQQKMIASLNNRLEREIQEKKDTAQKLKLAETQLMAARKEVLLLQRHTSASSTVSGNASQREDIRLQRALQEIDTLRSQVSTPSAAGGLAHTEPVEVAHLRSENKKLELQRVELMNCVRKQNKLIDVLKRQKIHLEAAKLLQIAEEEFVKVLEINQR